MNRTAMSVKQISVLAVVAATVAASPLWAKSSQEAGTPAATITLRVYDYANLDHATLAAAEKEASGILAQAGVSAQWIDCPTSHDAMKNYSGCTLRRPDDYIVSILPNTMAANLGKSGDTVGGADPQGGSRRAWVAYERISRRAGGDTATAEVLAGRVMAREIGSLLLGKDDVSSSGIMKATWTVDDLSMLAGSEMRFTPKQARQMDHRLVEEARARQAQSQTQVARNGK